MELRYYPVQWGTGEVLQYDLPLEAVQLSITEEGDGQASARLNLGAMLDSTLGDVYQQTAGVLDNLTPGATSLIAVREQSTNGSDNPTVDVVMGEWMVSELSAQHSNPVVEIRGFELMGWLANNVLKTDRRGRNADPVATARALFIEALDGYAFTIGGDATSTQKASFEFTAGVTTYKDAINELLGDRTGWSWRVQLTTNTSASDSSRRFVSRTIVLDSSAPSTDPVGVPIEINTPGGDPFTALEYERTTSLSAMCSELHAWGAGSGRSQLHLVTTKAMPPNVPRLSRTLSRPEAMTRERLASMANDAMWAAYPDKQPFTVLVRVDRITTPHMGRVHAMIIEPSLSMPHRREFNAKVTAWSWSAPQPGQLDVMTLTMEVV